MKKSRIFLTIAGFLVLLLSAFSTQGNAGVNVSVGINVPAFRFAAPPALVVIPGTYAYFAPEADVDIVFFNGFWYRPYEGRWFRARGYNGPWAFVAPGRVPRVLIDLPPDFRHAYAGHERIPYRDFNRNWRRWERDRYWERNERWKEGVRHERREGREERRERHEERRERGGRY